MANLNKVMFIGRLTRDVEVRDMGNGRQVANFSLATTRGWKNADGEKQEETTFVDFELFGSRAEILQKYAPKGRELFVEGRLRQDKWQAEDGTNRQKLVVIVEDFEFLGGKQNEGDNQAQQAAPATNTRQAPKTAPSRNTRNTRTNQPKEEPVPF